ncbi:MAG: dTDP-4-dehydrorhamnose reductase [Alphaproteobacteria bacterium]|nr:dTDP-4-dehydrorhamnose reductase [Alphaproteobacteria bacterium]
MKRILLLGANGMFGQDAFEIFTASGYMVLKAGRGECDVTNRELVQKFFYKNDFDLVINAAAYTKVDDAESHKAEAFAVNAEGAKNVAEAANKKSVPVVFISTDYVFDGEKTSPYEVGDKTNPLSVYGASKLRGEENTRAANLQHYIIRTSWLYGKNGKNFVDTMLNMAKSQKVIRVVNDQFGCPTWTHDLAFGIKKIIEEKTPFGTYHVCGGGVTSWYEFAKKIFEIAAVDVSVTPVSTSEFPRPARRPKFSAMKNDGMCRDWREALEKYLTSSR